MTSIALNTITAALAKNRGSYVAAIIADKDASALEVEKRGSNIEVRKAAWREAAEKAEGLKAALEEMTKYTTMAESVAAIAQGTEAHMLDQEEAVLVAQQIISGKMIEEVIKATYETAKSLVFQSLNIQFAEDGEEFPEQTNGYIEVPELGKKLSREGCGRKSGRLNEKTLQESVSEEVWAAITTEVVTREIDEDKLIAAITNNPALAEVVRESIDEGGWNTPRLVIRNLPQKKG